MKKILTYIAIAILAITATSCSNDDDNKNDALLTQQIIGKWSMQISQDKADTYITYTFAGTDFTYFTEEYADDITQTKTVSITGGWNIQHGKLQLNYNLATLRTTGYTQAETFQIRDGFNKENLLLADLNAQKQPYGPTVTFQTINNRTVLILSTFNGYFQKQ